MNIHLEPNNAHAIEAYSHSKIQINSQIYSESLIVSSKEIITSLPFLSIQELNSDFLTLLIRHRPQIIIIGHNNPGQFPSREFMTDLARAGTGFEFMDHGAAARTYNVLLNENRDVVAGFIFGAVLPEH